jgi:hypothetical protein
MDGSHEGFALVDGVDRKVGISTDQFTGRFAHTDHCGHLPTTSLDQLHRFNTVNDEPESLTAPDACDLLKTKLPPIARGSDVARGLEVNSQSTTDCGNMP